MKIFKVFSEQEVNKLNGIIDELEWNDGRTTAVGNAKKLKKNFQITMADPGFDQILPYINAVHNLPSVRNWTFTAEIVDPRLASYTDGGHYDWHTDSALMSKRRTDLSFSIFLRNAASYDGGEMEIKLDNNFQTQIKCNIGEMVVYSSGLLHKVNPVTSGERRVIVGWLKSNIKSGAHRDLLNNMREEIVWLQKRLGNADTDRLTQIYQQLLREFS